MNRNKALRVISLVIVFCFILTSVVFAVPANGKKAWKNEFKLNKSAEYMRDKGIMKGYGNGDFGFADYVKRGDVTVMIVRAFQMSTVLEEIEKGFADVPVDSYFYDAILAAKHYGIAKGDGKHFNPHKYVTIREAIALIERSMSVANTNAVFAKDIDLDELFDEEDLDKYATREDIAKMLYYVLTGDLFDGENDENDEDDENDGDDSDHIIVYETNNDSKVTFDDHAFNDAFYEFDHVKSDDKLDYVMFNLPSTSYGKLYYDYDAELKDNISVKSTYEYYYDSSSSSDKDISKVSFVPNKNYDGTFNIYYKAYDEDGDSYDGVIKMIVKDNISSLDKIKYTTYINTKMSFDSEDFEDVFELEADDDFDYAEFVLPDGKYGKLYSDFASSNLVKAGKGYGYSDIDKFVFVPAKDFEGSVKINYTAYDEDGHSYLGEVQIIVKDEEATLSMIKYTTLEDVKLTFDHDEFEDVYEDETDDEFNYVKFDLPEEKYGKLYYDYVSKSNYTALVDHDEEYDYADIDKITFVPANGFTGDAYIDYTAYDEYGDAYFGRIKITVK